jgi:hypothetical protein
MRIRGNARYAPAARNESQTAAARPWFGRTRNFKQLLQTNSSAAMIYSMPTSRSILSNCHNHPGYHVDGQSCGPRSFWCNKNTDSEFPVALPDSVPVGVRFSVLELFLETVFIIELQMRPLAE